MMWYSQCAEWITFNHRDVSVWVFCCGLSHAQTTE